MNTAPHSRLVFVVIVTGLLLVLLSQPSNKHEPGARLPVPLSTKPQHLSAPVPAKLSSISARNKNPHLQAQVSEDSKDTTQVLLDLHDDLLYHPNAQYRQAALLALLDTGTHAAYGIIPQALADNNIHVREMAIEALAEAGAKYIPVLGQVLFNELESSLRHLAVDALASYNDPAARSLLEAALGDSDRRVREQAEYWLQNLDWNNADGDLELTAAEIESAPTVDARLAEVRDLSHSNSADNDARLASILTTDVELDVRIEALFALAQRDDASSDALIPQALTDTEPQLRQYAIRLLAEPERGQLHILGQVLLNEPEAELRHMALALLADQKNPAAKALLTLALQDEDAKQRTDAPHLLQALD